MLTLSAGLLMSGPAAHAGQPCEVRPLRPDTAARALELAQRTARTLDASGADVVVLARVGQDLSRHGLRYSHLGYAVREAPGKPWRVVHKLNQCGTPTAALYRQGLAEFFLDDLHAYEAAVTVPTPDLQASLKPLLLDDARAATLHTARYNMVAYPWSTRYQQSNQWALETLALAAEPTATSRERAQAWLRFKGYEPTTLRVSTVTRLGARLTQAHVEFDDHPGERRFAGRIDTVTVESVHQFMQRTGLAGPVKLVRL
jgi:hypothetical protein